MEQFCIFPLPKANSWKPSSSLVRGSSLPWQQDRPFYLRRRFKYSF